MQVIDISAVCSPKIGLGTTVRTDFTQGKSNDWTVLDGTPVTYDNGNGAQFIITKLDDSTAMVFNKYIMFGNVEFVARASPGTGIVSSFALLSDNLDEIDWEWLGSSDSSVQTNFFGKGNHTTYDRGTTVNATTPVETWHTYTIDWTSGRTIWSIDGNTVRTLNFDDPKTYGGKFYPQTPMQIRFANWIGCKSSSDPGTAGRCTWAGGPLDTSKGPFPMYLKSVTIQDYGCGGEYSYSDMSGSWQSIKSSIKCDAKGTGTGDLSYVSPISSFSTSAPATFSSASPTLSSFSKPPITGNSTSTLPTSTTSISTTKSSSTSAVSAALATSSKNSATWVKPKYQFRLIDFNVSILTLGVAYFLV